MDEVDGMAGNEDRGGIQVNAFLVQPEDDLVYRVSSGDDLIFYASCRK